MNILWMSDSPTRPTGYAHVTRVVCAGLANCGHQVSLLGWQTRSQERWHTCPLYPMPLACSFTDEALLGYLRRLRPDVFVVQGDLWWLRMHLNYQRLAEYLHTAGIPWAFYNPIDGDLGDYRLPSDWIELLKQVNLPIVMSQYGAQACLANGVKAAYIPLGVDTRVFSPPQNKEQAKRALGYEGRFVILSDARNQLRKLLPRALEIFHRFAKGKDDVLLHLHCDPEDPLAYTSEYSCDLRSEIATRGLTKKVRFTPGMSIATGLPLANLVKLYQAADVHLLASWGEGFGLPTLQAAATGVVPMASDYSASRELVSGHGEAIRVQRYLLDQFGVRRAFIDIEDAVSRLERLYHDREGLAAKAQSGRRFAEAYDWEHIVQGWHELLQREIPLRQSHHLVRGRW